MSTKLDKKKITLAVAHHIHLTRDQRYRVIDGEMVEVVGVSVPVWHYHGRTSEPAREIFCKYILTNWADAEEGVRQNSEGYEINLPQISKQEMQNIRISDEDWRNLSGIMKEAYYQSLKFPVTAKNLTDIKDGGSACILFNQYSKVTLNQLLANGIHFVRIEDISVLEDSMF